MKKYKIVLNKSFGGFCLSPKALQLLGKKRGNNYQYFYRYYVNHFEKCSLNDAEWLSEIDFGKFVSPEIFHNNLDNIISCYHNPYRHEKALVETVEELGSEEASGYCAKLEIVTINSNVYNITDYDGMESVETLEESDKNWIIINW